MTGIVGITALQELRTFRGFENAIIAGGFVRDSLLGGKVKDLDVFIPCRSYDDFTKTVEQYFKSEIIKTDSPELRISENEFETWVRNQEDKGNNPFKEYKFDFSVLDACYIAKPFKKNKTIVTAEIGNFKGFVRDETDRAGYREISKSYITHYNCKYMGFLDVDIIGYVSNQTKDFNGNIINDFGDQLISEFSYNIDKTYFNGSETIQSKEFQSDTRNHTATLVKLDSLEGLPHAMRKYERLREKYPNFRFRSTVLEVKQKEKEEDKSDRKLYKYQTITNSSTGIAW